MEQRVKTLEQEMKILKNQIQKTLLDVQEQVLLRYHQALRSDEGIASGNGNGNGNGYGYAAAEKSKLAEINYRDYPPTPASEPLVRQVSLADLRSTPAPVESPASGSTTGGQDSFAALARWVAESVGQIGGERTRTILALRAAATAIPPHIHETLNKLIILYSEDEKMRQGTDMLQQLNQLLDTEPSHTK